MRKDYLQQSPAILREFLLYMETIRGRSALTVEEYFFDLRTFMRFLLRFRDLVPPSLPDEEISILPVDLPLLQSVTLADVYEYMNYAKNERSNTNKTRARKTTSLRVFFKYLTDYKHLLPKNPIQDLDTPKIKKALPKYLTLDQSLALLNSVRGEFAQRDYCMLTLLLNCGLRRAELAGVNISDIRPDRTLRVRGKGNKERILYLNDACMDAIERYLKVRPRDGVADRDALFLSRLKQRISLQGVHFVVKQYLKQVPGAEEYSTHKLRHTAATLMYQKGGVDIRVLKDILGHENLGTTEIYTHLSMEQIQKAEESNPLSAVKAPSALDRIPKRIPQEQDEPQEESSATPENDT